MNPGGWNETLQDLLVNYEQGMYLPQEVVSASISLFGADNSDELWGSLPDWVKEKIIEKLKDFNESDEVVCFGMCNPEQVKKQNLLVKSWLISSGLI